MRNLMKSKFGIDGAILKIIAIVSMTIDHMAVAFTSLFSSGVMDVDMYFLARKIGRIAFPIYCFLIAQGMVKSKNKIRYMVTLGVFALISEIPFNLVINNCYFSLRMQNVMFTLLIGALVIYGMQKVEEIIARDKLIQLMTQIAIVILGIYLADFMKTDYAGFGVLIIAVFYMYRDRFWISAIVCAVILYYMGGVEVYAIISLAILAFYNGKRGKQYKYLGYIYYPAHLLLLYIIVKVMFSYR